jgi:serine/threonine protein kinase
VHATGVMFGGRYLLGDLIGRGGGADVYRAEDIESQEPVAVKVLRVATPDDMRRFAVEAQTLGRLDHPAIVRLRDEGTQDGVPYLVLDLVDGEPLSECLARGPLPDRDVARIGAVLAGALAHAHALGVVHRDVKPGNVLIEPSGDVHLTDFGIARLTDRTAITATGLVIGTAAYLAPEQVKGEAVGPATDIYPLGLVLIEALSGERAFTGSPSEAALARLRHAPVIPPDTSPALAATLMSMTAEDPAMRPSAGVVAETLADCARPGERDATAVLPVMAAPAAAAAPVAPVATRHRRAGLVAAAVLVFVLLLGWLSANTGSLPADAVTSTTTTAVAAPTTAPPATEVPVTQAQAPAPAPPSHKGKHGKGDGG